MSSAPDATCDYCDLPLPKPFWATGSSENVTSDKPAYCCLGCQFASAVTREKGEAGAIRWTLTSLGIAIFFTMNVMVFSLVLWQDDLFDAAKHNTDEFSQTLSSLFRYLSLIFSIPVLFLLGRPLAENAWANLKRGLLSTDLLLITGVLAAYAYSVSSVIAEEGKIYFEVGCMVLVLVTLGRWLEATGRFKSTNALDALQKSLPETVTLIKNGQQQTIPIEEIQAGDTLRVLAGERFPTDAVLLENRTTVDEQAVTGESWPLEKNVGDVLLGGTLNLNSVAIISASATADQGTLARLIEAVRIARLQKGEYEKFADKVTRWFFPIITLIAVAAFWYHSANVGVDEGLKAMLAVVLIACPCALGLATPMAIWASLGRAASAGVLFRNGEALEKLAAVRAICFDKTGTLTTGVAQVKKFITEKKSNTVKNDDSCNKEILQIAASLAENSTHVFSAAIMNYQEVTSKRFAFNNIHSEPGMGLRAESPALQTTIWLGSYRWLIAEGMELTTELKSTFEEGQQQGLPMTFVGWEGKVRAIFLFQEELRPYSKELFRWCELAQLHATVLTGDHLSRGEHLSQELNVPVLAELLPDEKVAAIIQAKQQWGAVAMVGDGINDAPALAASDVGIAMGCGTDITRDSASICLLGNELNRLPWSVALAHQTVRTIKQNLFWAFGYNSIGVIVAAFGLLNPALAALLMAVSSLFVISNSLRLNNVAIPVESNTIGNVEQHKTEFTKDI